MNIETVGIVGCGAMGSAIAEAAALARFRVVAVKATAGSLEPATRRIEGSLDRAAARGKLTAEERSAVRSRMTFGADLDALAGCDLVLECTAETLSSKRRILSEIEATIPARAIVASTTSSLPLRQLATALATPSRFIGLHFLSPVPTVKVVELGRVQQTSDEVVSGASAFVQSLGKTPLLLGDEPGYIVSRLQVPYLCQAIEMLEAGVATARDIDAAMQVGGGHPSGPLALSDQLGLDVVFSMAQTLSVELRDKRFRPPTLLRRLVLAGHLGRKTRLGIYDYRGGEPTENGEIRAALLSAPDLGRAAG